MQCSDLMMLKSMQEELNNPLAYQNSTLEAQSPTASVESPRSPLFKVSEELKAKFTPQKQLSVSESNIPQESQKAETTKSAKKSEVKQPAQVAENKLNTKPSQLSPTSENAASGADLNVESLDATLNPIGVPGPESEQK